MLALTCLFLLLLVWCVGLVLVVDDLVRCCPCWSRHLLDDSIRLLSYQAVVAPIASPQDVTAVLSALRRNEPWNCAITPFAYRFDEPNIDSGTHPSADQAVAVAFRQGCRDSDFERERADSSSSAGPGNSRNNNSSKGDDFGAGEKILNLLRTLDISNVLVVAARWSRKSFSGSGLVSPARFSALAAATQAGLQRCFDRCDFERTQPPLRLPPRADRLPLRRRQSRLEVQDGNNDQDENNGFPSAAMPAASRDFDAGEPRAKSRTGNVGPQVGLGNNVKGYQDRKHRARQQKGTRSGPNFAKRGSHGGGIAAARLLRAHSSAKTQHRPAATVSVSSFDPQISHRFGEGVLESDTMAGEGKLQSTFLLRV